MRKSTTPKGVASSLALLPRVGCVALANPALSKVYPRWGNNSDKSLKSVLLLLRLHMIKQKLRACTWFVQALKMMLGILSMPMF